MQQPFLIVFPLFISVFIVRVLPRVILAPVALLVLIVMHWWSESIVDKRQPPVNVPLLGLEGYEPSGTETWL